MISLFCSKQPTQQYNTIQIVTSKTTTTVTTTTTTYLLVFHLILNTQTSNRTNEQTNFDKSLFGSSLNHCFNFSTFFVRSSWERRSENAEWVSVLKPKSYLHILFFKTFWLNGRSSKIKVWCYFVNISVSKQQFCCCCSCA